MTAVEEIILIALNTLPDLVTIVPENRQELTTEGGLNVSADIKRFKKVVERMHEKDIEVSYFIEPDLKQIDAVVQTGADMVEFHTGTYANAKIKAAIDNELSRIAKASLLASEHGLKIAAGHGLNYINTQAICNIPQICELSIGHSIMARAIHVGTYHAVKEMIHLIKTSVMMRNKE